MITSKTPETWQQLEQMTASILIKCGFKVEVQKELEMVRGTTKIDVYAEQSVRGRTLRFLFECKHWSNPVPKAVVHSFRTVVTDSGAHLGYLVSKEGFQSGAEDAADLSNIRLLTWSQFQSEFEMEYYEHHVRSTLHQHVDRICSFVEPTSPGALSFAGRLDENNMEAYLALKEKYEAFVFLCMSHFPYMTFQLGAGPLKLPLSESEPALCDFIPSNLAHIAGFEEFLEAVLELSTTAHSEFTSVLYPLKKR